MTLRWMLAALTLTAASTASAGFRPGEVVLESVVFSGTGCPAGTVRAELAPDASAITILYDAFQAQTGATVFADRKNCEVIIKMRKPNIYSFALESADFRGFVYAQRGARATQEVKIETGMGDLAKANVNLAAKSWVGPVNENFILTAVKPVEGLKYLSCLQPRKDARLRVKSTVTVENGGSRAEAMITVDSVDGRLVQRYNLKWMNCLEVGAGLIGRLLGN